MSMCESEGRSLPNALFVITKVGRNSNEVIEYEGKLKYISYTNNRV
jgi:hypothetical protein